MKNTERNKIMGVTGLRPALVMMMALVMTIVTACAGSEPPAPPTDPLTGATVEQGFDESAADQRIVAFVVENSPEARPQFGIDDEQYSPDIILEGEVEAGITRMLWLYSDYNKLPEVIGPMRSARPPYIRFSELFDAVFIHWGASHSKGMYVGANTVFKDDEVDHIDQTTYSGDVDLYDRDETRDVATEHTGIVYGAKVPEALKEAGFRELPDNYTVLKFNEEAQAMSDKRADDIVVDYSEKTSWESTAWKYNAEDQKYHTGNFGTEVTRDNLLILYDKTEYIDKDDYWGQTGNTITYCDYALGGGEGVLISQGTYKEIEWRVEDGKLILIDPNAEVPEEQAEDEEAPDYVEACLNPGKTWIGWVSSNNDGNVKITADESAETAADGE